MSDLAQILKKDAFGKALMGVYSGNMVFYRDDL
jgi:hypothetical protein